MKTTLKLLAPAMALPLALGLAAPAASAQDRGWSEYRQDARYDRYEQRRGNRGHAVVQRRISQFAQDVRVARRSGVLSRGEAYSLRERLNTLERAYSALARNGLTRRDVGVMNWRIDQAYEQLARAQYNQQTRYDDRRGYRYRR